MATPWKIRRTVDLEKWEQKAEHLGILAFTGAKNAHQLILTVFENDEPVSFASATSIMAYFMRAGEQVMIKGSVTSNVLTIKFPAAAYAIQTRVSVLICAENTDEKVPLYAAVFDPGNGSENAIIDPDDMIPDVSELLAQIEAAKSATAAANKAAQTAETGEASRVAAETKRVNAETARASAEQTRVTNENARKTAETSRASAETTRASAEQTRVTNENARKTAETNRVNAENSRVTAENTRQTAETSRANAETERAEAEKKRVAAETARVAAESARVTEHQNNQTASQQQTNRAKEAADKLSDIGLELETLPPSADPTGSVDQTANKTTFRLGIPASNFAYATFWIDPETRQLMMRIPDGFTALTFLIQNRRLVVRING